MRQLLLLTSVEFKEYLREPGTIFWAMLFPILLALGLGLAFSGGGALEKRVAVVCQNSRCELPREADLDKKLVLGNEKTGIMRFEFQQVAWEEALLMLKQGKISMILEVDRGAVQYHFDPANSDANFSYVQLSSYFRNVEPDPNEITVLEQKGTRYIDYLIPGLLAMGIMMSCMWGIGYSNVDRRTKKLLRRMVATPMKKSNYVISQLIARLAMSAMESVLLVLITKWIFDVSITGSFGALILLFLAGNVAFTGLALIIASRTANNQIANGFINLVVMPMMILSGVYFSYHNFPDFMVAVIQFLPLTILADSIRSVFVEGAGIVNIWGDALVLGVFGTVLFSIGIRIYRWY